MSILDDCVETNVSVEQYGGQARADEAISPVSSKMGSVNGERQQAGPYGQVLYGQLLKNGRSDDAIMTELARLNRMN